MDYQPQIEAVVEGNKYFRQVIRSYQSRNEQVGRRRKIEELLRTNKKNNKEEQEEEKKGKILYRQI